MSYKKAYYKILTVLIIVLLAISNPTYEEHKKYVKDELSKEIFGTDKGFIGFFGKGVSSVSLFLEGFTVSNYILFSIGKNKRIIDGKTSNYISLGIGTKVFLLKNIVELIE